MSVLASHIYILGYLLKRLLSKASLLVLLFLFLKVLLLYFLPLLGLFKALKCLPPIVLIMLHVTDLISRIVQVLRGDLYWVKISVQEAGLIEPVEP